MATIPTLNQDESLGGSLSGYFQKKQKKPETGIESISSATPTFSAPSASPMSAPRGSGGKSPTGFVGFEQYFGANAPAVQKMTQGAVASAAAPRPTAGQMAKVAPTSLQAGVPRGVSFGLSAPPRLGGQAGEIKTRTGAAPQTTEQQIAQAKAGQERLKTLGEPGGYEAQAQYSPELERFDAMLMGGMLPQQAKAEASRLGALERRLTEQEAGRAAANQRTQEEALLREEEFRRAWAEEDRQRREAERRRREYESQDSVYGQEYDQQVY